MTQRKESLQALLAKVEAGADFEQYGFSDFSSAFPTVQSGADGPWTDHATDCAIKSYNGSLDAAMALHKAVLAGWEYGVTHNHEQDEGPCAFVCEWAHDDGFEAVSETPARAWLIAILKALISEADA